MNNSPFTTILAACAVIVTAVLIYVVMMLPEPTTTPLPQQPPAYAPNYPLNMEITSYIGKPDLDETFVAAGMGDKLISFVHKVTFDETKRVYVYHYKLSYVGKEKCFFSWELLDRVINNQTTQILADQPPSTSNSKLIELLPNKVKELSMESQLPPALYEGAAWIYRQKKDDKTIWELVRVNAQAGPLPRQNQ
jgi:hypothetical protein